MSLHAPINKAISLATFFCLTLAPADTPAPATASAADAAPSGPVGKVEIKELVFDAGKVDRGTDVSHAFTIKNVGPGDLTVDAKPG